MWLWAGAHARAFAFVRSFANLVLFIYLYLFSSATSFVRHPCVHRTLRETRTYMNVSPLLSCCCASWSSPQPPTVDAQPFIFSCAEATLWRGSAKPTQSETMINFGMIHKIFIICVQQQQQQQCTHCAEPNELHCLQLTASLTCNLFYFRCCAQFGVYEVVFVASDWYYDYCRATVCWHRLPAVHSIFCA